MEEKKEAKQLKMSPTGGERPEKLSYEKVMEIANSLHTENQKLRQQLQQAYQIIHSFNRLDYLLAILKLESVIKDPEFIQDCVAEVKEFMSIKEPSKEDGGKE